MASRKIGVRKIRNRLRPNCSEGSPSSMVGSQSIQLLPPGAASTAWVWINLSYRQLSEYDEYHPPPLGRRGRRSPVGETASTVFVVLSAKIAMWAKSRLSAIFRNLLEPVRSTRRDSRPAESNTASTMWGNDRRSRGLSGRRVGSRRVGMLAARCGWGCKGVRWDPLGVQRHLGLARGGAVVAYTLERPRGGKGRWGEIVIKE
jgi:hypothetical protein